MQTIAFNHISSYCVVSTTPNSKPNPTLMFGPHCISGGLAIADFEVSDCGWLKATCRELWNRHAKVEPMRFDEIFFPQKNTSKWTKRVWTVTLIEFSNSADCAVCLHFQNQLIFYLFKDRGLSTCYKSPDCSYFQNQLIVYIFKVSS